jgi:hypothetical protein
LKRLKALLLSHTHEQAIEVLVRAGGSGGTVTRRAAAER